MTETQMRELVSAAFLAGWATAAPGVPAVLENDARPDAGDAFVQLTIQPTTSRQMTTGRRGTRRIQRKVWLQLKVWSPAGIGMRRTPEEVAAGAPKRGAELLDAARTVLETQSFEGPASPGDEPVTTETDVGGPSGSDGRWWMGLVRVSAWYAETK